MCLGEPSKLIGSGEDPFCLSEQIIDELTVFHLFSCDGMSDRVDEVAQEIGGDSSVGLIHISLSVGSWGWLGRGVGWCHSSGICNNCGACSNCLNSPPVELQQGKLGLVMVVVGKLVLKVMVELEQEILQWLVQEVAVW